ncbi:FUSC family protein [Glutamicibacter sp. JL.03c]|uniref:FUSC family protein n=1 Tax=Glutamicibacter sp. JL.03c TaxID=2984842 RepID=UPI0021F6E42F|nr:FUSC family protein [Glutamicibacter sp. JL.03c]UYQ77218.1 FUSC family protein [Glutamicibacter sp. JL.03c]
MHTTPPTAQGLVPRLRSRVDSLVSWRLLVVAHSPEIRPALRVGIGLGIPGTALLLTDRIDLLAYAVFGSVVGMYGRDPHRWQRFKNQLLGAGLMLCAGICGIALAPVGLRGWSLLAGGILCAVLSSMVADRHGLKPGGAFFPLFAFGALGTLPVGETLALDGLIAFVATALFSILLGQMARFGPAAEHGIQTQALPWPNILRRAGTYLVVIAAAGSIGIGLQVEHLQWTMAGAAVPLAAGNARGMIKRGTHRIMGTLAGIGVLLALQLMEPSEFFIGCCIIGLIFPTEAYMVRNYGLALSFFTPLILLMLQLANPRIGAQMVWDCAMGNLLGVLVGILIAGAIERTPRLQYSSGDVG